MPVHLILADEIGPYGPFLIEDPKILLAQMIGLVLFLLIVFRLIPKALPLGIPYLADQSQERAGRIETNMQQVEMALADTQRLHDDYANRLKGIEAEARTRIDAAVREAELARADIISDAEETTKQLRRRAEDELAREQTRQRILLRQQIVALTLDAAEQSARDHSTAQTQRHLISDFITRAADGKATAASAAPFVAAANRTPAAQIFETPTFDRTEGA